MFYKDEDLGLSAVPLFAASRILLERNLASPDDTIETWRGDLKSMYGRVGHCATLTVEERSVGGIRFVKWSSNDKSE